MTIPQKEKLIGSDLRLSDFDGPGPDPFLTCCSAREQPVPGSPPEGPDGTEQGGSDQPQRAHTTPTELNPNSEQGEHFWSGGSRRDVAVLTAGCWNAAVSLSDRPPFTGCCYIRRHPQLHLTTPSTGAEAVGPQRRSGPSSGSRYLPGWSFVGSAAFRRFKSSAPPLFGPSLEASFSVFFYLNF